MSEVHKVFGLFRKINGDTTGCCHCGWESEAFDGANMSTSQAKAEQAVQAHIEAEACSEQGL